MNQLDKVSCDPAGPARPGRCEGKAAPGTVRDQETLRSQSLLPPGSCSMDEGLRGSLSAGLFHWVEQPTRIGRFALSERLGAGAMGEVHLAHDSYLGRNVAIKLVRPQRLVHMDQDPARCVDSQRLVREAQALARVSHPNVVHVYEVGLWNDRVFIVMELVRGQSLRQWLAAQRHATAPERWRQVLEIFLAAGQGLQAVHDAGLTHRDLKPDNILVGADGRVRLADFGLARNVAITEETPDTRELPRPNPRGLEHAGTLAMVRNLTATDAIIGTPGYMSPEQMRGEPCDARSDQFSFCVSLYEALYRVRPFPGRSLADLRRQVLEEGFSSPPRDADVPAWIGKVIARGLAMEPADRYPDMADLLAALARPPRTTRRLRTAAALLLGAGALVGSMALHAWNAAGHVSGRVAEDHVSDAGHGCCGHGQGAAIPAGQRAGGRTGNADEPDGPGVRPECP